MSICCPAFGSRTLDYTTAHRWFGSVIDDDCVVIDLGEVTFVDSLGLALIAAEAERAFHHGAPVDFTPPARASVANYMARMNLDEFLDQLGIDPRLPDVRAHNVGSRLLELQRFSYTDVDRIGEGLHAAMIDLGASTQDASDIFRAVTEVMINVEHSDTDSGCIAMQVMPSGTHPQITFAIADTGIGLQSSLARQHFVNDDHTAIQLAFTRGISGLSQGRRGQGLHDLRLRVGKRGGQLHAWTGDVRAESYRDGWRHQTLASPYQGTMIYARWTPAATAHPRLEG